MAQKQRTEIDFELLEKLRRRAEEQGRTETEVLEEAVGRYIDTPRTLAGLFDEAEHWQKDHDVEPLTEEEAMRLANEELHATRRERESGK